MSTTSITPPPPPAVIYGGGQETPSQYPSEASSSSIITVITIIASAIIISGSIYLVIRYLTRRFQPSFSAEDGGAVLGRAISSNQQQQRHAPPGDLIDSLPLFTFRSVTPSITAAGDCAVCLSKFEPHDQLRLLPLCCHAFHAACIDAWIVSNKTCPLCRSSVLPSAANALHKILSSENRGKITNGSTEAGGSFRIEIGNISRRHDGVPETAVPDSEQQRQSYSVGGGEFEYIVGEDNAFEVSLAHTTHSRQFSDLDSNDKSSVGISIPAGEVSDAEVSGGRNLLKECVDRLASISSSSRTMSFRSSGMFFSGSSRRSEAATTIVDLEAYRAGEEISEIFRWLSGV